MTKDNLLAKAQEILQKSEDLLKTPVGQAKVFIGNSSKTIGRICTKITNSPNRALSQEDLSKSMKQLDEIKSNMEMLSNLRKGNNETLNREIDRFVELVNKTESLLKRS